MPQRSFRVSDAALTDLSSIAAHLARLNHRAPNQTAALAWAIARGVDALAKSEALGGQIPESLQQQVEGAARELSNLASSWRRAADFQSINLHRKATAAAEVAAENEALRQRVTELEAELERAKAIPYRASTG
jgi:plasmid stabilization system protein ParE